MSGVVYVMNSWADDGTYKIGCTSDVRKRFAKRSVERIVYQIIVPDDCHPRDLENLVHALFASRRVTGHGELFRLTADDLRLLHRMQKSRNPKHVVETVPDGIRARWVRRCNKCGHEWKSRLREPKECPNCKSRAWR